MIKQGHLKSCRKKYKIGRFESSHLIILSSVNTSVLVIKFCLKMQPHAKHCGIYQDVMLSVFGQCNDVGDFKLCSSKLPG